jgi:sugar phosphate isomerase/epimerase
MQLASSKQSVSRRSFLKRTSACCGAAALGATGLLPNAFAQSSNAKWAGQMGLELYTVRDLLADDFEGTIAKVAQIGYKEVEPANGYNDLSPKDFRKLMDKYGLSAISTHTGPTSGPDLEKQLEGFQIMGIKYTSAPRPPRPAPTGPPAKATGAYLHGRNSWTQVEAFAPEQKVVNLEEAKRRAAELNKWGNMGKKFGVKMLVHNHVAEFAKLLDSDMCEYDVYLKECDPEVVTMQLDIAWAIIAGQDIINLFKKNPGRFELWHMKDVFGLVGIDTSIDPYNRTNRTAFVPYGSGQLDYKPFFDQAELAGLKHFCIEQDDAAAWGDSMAAARISYKNLRTMLTTGTVPDAYYRQSK